MLKRSAFTALVLLATLALPIGAQSQPSLGENLGEFYSYGDRYFIEFVTLPGSVSGKARTIIPFRLAYDLMTFRRSPARRQEELYTATPEMYVEAVASDGVIADRALWRDTLKVSSYSATNAKHLYVPGTVELDLRPGLYRFRYVLADEGPGSGMTEETPPIRIDDFSSPSPAIGMPMFMREISGDTLVASAIGGGARFGEHLRVFVPLAGGLGGTLRYDLMSTVKVDKVQVPSRTVLSGRSDVVDGRTLGPAIVDDGEIRFVLARPGSAVGDSVGGARTASAIVDARIDDLVPGEYLLLLSYGAGQGSVTDTVRFRLRWIDQPVSLYRPAYAIRALYPIASDETIESLARGNAEQQTTALNRFWSEKDPTPATEFNEAMAEYYRRVDYAFFNFRTIGQKDGAFTDRGKIYVLYGPPTSVDRQMQPNSYPREVWTYRLERDGQSLLNRQFVFVDESKTGAYRLVEYHDL